MSWQSNASTRVKVSERTKMQLLSCKSKHPIPTSKLLLTLKHSRTKRMYRSKAVKKSRGSVNQSFLAHKQLWKPSKNWSFVTARSQEWTVTLCFKKITSLALSILRLINSMVIKSKWLTRSIQRLYNQQNRQVRTIKCHQRITDKDGITRIKQETTITWERRNRIWKCQLVPSVLEQVSKVSPPLQDSETSNLWDQQVDKILVTEISLTCRLNQISRASQNSHKVTCRAQKLAKCGEKQPRKKSEAKTVLLDQIPLDQIQVSKDSMSEEQYIISRSNYILNWSA